MEDHRFIVDIPGEDLVDLKARLKRRRIPAEFDNPDWRLGVDQGYLESLVDYWINDYSWRATEAAINAFEHYRLLIDGMPIHFIRVRGKGPATRALLLSHGWPWTFWDYHQVIAPLADPGAHGGDPADAFDVIVPSLPGFGFSTPLKVPGMNFVRTAELWVTLMTDVLGYESFFAHGGDLGNLITGQLGHRHADRVRGIHLVGAVPLGMFSGLNPITLPDWGFKAKAGVPQNQLLRQPNVLRARPQSPHMAIHINEPQTISYALNDSPVGLLAWMLQRRRWWSDNDGNIEDSFTREFLVTSTMLYWLTECYSTSARYYAEMVNTPWQPAHDLNPVVQAPTGITFFDHDATSQSRFWVEDYYNIHYLNSIDSGGHFAAMESPRVLVDEIRKTFRALRD